MKLWNTGTIAAVTIAALWIIFCWVAAGVVAWERRKCTDPSVEIKASRSPIYLLGAIGIVSLLIPLAILLNRQNDIKKFDAASEQLMQSYPEIREINELHLTTEFIVYQTEDGRGCRADLVHIEPLKQWVIDGRSIVCTLPA